MNTMIILTSRPRDEIVRLFRASEKEHEERGSAMAGNEEQPWSNPYTAEQKEKILSFCTNNTSPDGKSIWIRPEEFEEFYKDFPKRTVGGVLAMIRLVANRLDIKTVHAEGVKPHMEKKRAAERRESEERRALPEVPRQDHRPTLAEQLDHVSGTGRDRRLLPSRAAQEENWAILQAMANGVRLHYAAQIAGKKQLEEKLTEAKRSIDSLSVLNGVLREEMEGLKKQLRIMKKLREAAFEASKEIERND